MDDPNNPFLNNEQEDCLENVPEDSESGDSETATEVEVSEKALKFKISTESNLTGRKSYPGSRKGSRERVQHLNSSDLAKVIQKGKLRTGALSFDHQCLSSHKKFSFDAPEFLDEYAITLKNKFEGAINDKTDGERDKLCTEPRDKFCGEARYKLSGEARDKYCSESRDKFCGESTDKFEANEDESNECVLSKETLNLNKRNSEHSVKVPANLDEKRSILKSSEIKSFSKVDKLRMNNIKSEFVDVQVCCELPGAKIEDCNSEGDGQVDTPRRSSIDKVSMNDGVTKKVKFCFFKR